MADLSITSPEAAYRFKTSTINTQGTFSGGDEVQVDAGGAYTGATLSGSIWVAAGVAVPSGDGNKTIRALLLSSSVAILSSSLVVELDTQAPSAPDITEGGDEVVELDVDPKYGQNKVTVAWPESGASDCTGYKVYLRNGTPGNYTYELKATIVGKATVSTSFNLAIDHTEDGEALVFLVTAYDDLDNESPYAGAEVTTLYSYPSMAEDVDSSLPGVERVRLVWDYPEAGNTNLTGFEIERRKGEGEWENVAEVGPEVREYVDYGSAESPLEGGAEYDYRIAAIASAL